MPICENCNSKWSWKQTMKILALLKTEMICPHCNEKQYQSKKSQAFAPFLSLIVLLPLIISALVDLPVIVFLIFIPVIAIAIFLMFPFFVKLSSKEDYYFNTFKDQ